MYYILDAVVRIMAPVMIFTAEEIWQYMPATHEKPESVHMVSMPKFNELFFDDKLARAWEKLLSVRREVTKALEMARAEKRIGHPLDAQVTLWCDETLTEFLSPYKDELRTIFITSMVHLGSEKEASTDAMSTEMAGLSISVSRSTAEKCQRCWIHDTSVGTDPANPELCTRCKLALEESGE